MVLYQLDLTRIIQIFVAQGIVCFIFLFLAYKILKRGKRRLNTILSASFICPSIGCSINFIYILIYVESIVLVLYYMTLYFIILFIIFLLLFLLLLFKSEKVINTRKQTLFFLIFAVLLFCMVFIPGGVTINSSTDWKPVWSIYFCLYLMIIITFYGFIPTLMLSMKIYAKLENEHLRKKWRFFIIGMIGMFIFTFGTFISNTLNDQTFRIAWSLISLVLVIISPYLMYYGVGKQISE